MKALKIAIVTGASAGMGREFVKQLPFLYRQLDEIWVIARRKERLEELVLESVIPLRIFDGDMLKADLYERLENTLSEEQPDIRMLVNAAGFGKIGSVTEILKKEPKAQREMIDLNCNGLTDMTLLCMPWLSKGSRIVNLASAAAFCPQPGFAVYAATKAYVLSFSRALNEELKKQGISVTVVCPGPVKTEFFSVSGNPSNWLKKMSMSSPEKVVRKALLDAKEKKELSVYGGMMKIANVGAKIIPHRLVIALENIGNE